MHSLLLTGRREFQSDALLAIAEEVGLDREEARTALEKRTFRERVLADVAGGRRAGARGTPTFFVDGERLEGPWRQLAQLIPAKLADR